MQIAVLAPFCASRLTARAIFGGPFIASGLDFRAAIDPGTAAMRFDKYRSGGR
jgi:hypothetical protein